MKTFISLFIFSQCIIFSLSAQVLTGSWAGEEVPGAEKVWLKDHRLIPAFVRYEDQSRIPVNQFPAYFEEKFVSSQTGYTLVQKTEEPDPLGHIHYRHIQYYLGIPVEGSMVIVHSENNEVYSFNGDFFDVKKPEMTVNTSEQEALQAAIDFTGATTYQWDLPGENALIFGLHDIQREKVARLPKGELVIVPVAGDYEAGDYRLAWKFDIFAAEPLSRTYTFVDAIQGGVIHQLDRIHTADTMGTAVTKYSGSQPITTDLMSNGQFRLRETGRGSGIVTRNMQNGTSYNAAVDFLDDDNTWNNVNAQQNEVATDAHWGAEMTYDYFLQKYGRNSIDGNGFPLTSFVHFSNNFANAFWTGERMVYGDGSPGSSLGSPLTTLDICGHEIAHGLTTFSAGLIYSNESGALNESFSDIFGKCIEAFARPGNTNWRIGNDLGGGFRDMANPLIFGNPKNYLGNAWFTGTFDNGGVHINSGVQNHWFYLLTEGGTGTNDFGDNYTVQGLGIDTAGAIAFRNLTVYLTPSSQYIDARFFAVESAIDLYGPCGRPHINVTNAWYAVGVGNEFSPVPIVDFGAVDSTTCIFPYEIYFREETRGAGSFQWDFGDGTTSNMVNPIHAFPGPGTYTVTLNINGVCGGMASKTRTSFVTVFPSPATPVGMDESTNCESQAVLVATGTDQIQWRNATGSVLAIGDTFRTAPLTQNTSYFAYNMTVPISQQAGALDSTIGGGGYLSADTRHLVFDVYKPQILEKVTMYAAADGYRIIEYRDRNANILASKSVFLSAGENRVQLGFELRVGVDQQLALKGIVGVFGNNSGLSYPYDLSSVLTIKGINDNVPTRQYLFFYDWEVRDVGCVSQPAEVKVSINAISADPVIANETRCGPGTVSFQALAYDSTVNWYDNAGTLLAIGPNFTTPALTSTTSYLAENVRFPSAQKIGPADKNIGANNYFRNFVDNHLTFSALQPVLVKSVWVDADVAGPRSIFLTDGTGTPLDTLEVMLPAGPSRIALDLDLPAGDYRIGGIDLGLSRTTSNLRFPYSLDGVFEITGSSSGLSAYYFFYDFEIREEGCVSSQVTVTATVTPGPSADFSFTQSLSTVDFTDLSTGASGWTWDFGDGNTSSLQNPTHIYTAPGTYAVLLTTSDGSCDNMTMDSVTVSQITSVDQVIDLGIQLYPNPGTGKFIVEWETVSGSDVQIEVFDLLGKKIYQSEKISTSLQKKEVELTRQPKGTYLIRVQAGDKVAIRKYLLSFSD